LPFVGQHSFFLVEGTDLSRLSLFKAALEIHFLQNIAEQQLGTPPGGEMHLKNSLSSP
jgi:hypothetical protein